MKMTYAGITGFFIKNRRSDQEMTVAVVVLVHTAFTFHIYDPVRLFFPWEYRFDVLVAVQAIRVAVIRGIRRK
jgi:hypothetical protein